MTSLPGARLDGKHVVYGSVTKGMEVVQACEAVGSQVRQRKAPSICSPAYGLPYKPPYNIRK
jgi:cyclophilin family peptidyl-prolyl cis-trans isomerase